MNINHRKAVTAASLAAVAILSRIRVFGRRLDLGRTADRQFDHGRLQRHPETRWISGWIRPPDLVGPGCAAYAGTEPDRPRLGDGMAQDPVAVAASNNPLLTTLTAAVSGKLNPDVNLVDTLNGGEFTVFAPTDDAFAKIDPATIDTLKTDAPLLTSILTYHVVPGRLSPAQVVGTHKTVRVASVTVTGCGQRPQGQRRGRDLRRGADRQRDGVPDRHGADAASAARHVIETPCTDEAVRPVPGRLVMSGLLRSNFFDG